MNTKSLRKPRTAPPRRRRSVGHVFPKRLADWRKENNLLLRHLAHDLDLSVSIICEWENGHRFPSVNHMEQLAERMGVPACNLVCPEPGLCRYCRTAALKNQPTGAQSRRAKAKRGL
jgi:transcriptional regulator with XRE-family HTH domain